MADLMGPDGLAAGIVRAVAQGDRYRLLHVHRHGDEQRALFRTTTANGGFDYLDFILLRDADGKVHAGDFYDYVNGELESEDLHRQVPRIVVQASPDFLWKLPPTDREYVLHQSDVEQMRTLVAARKYREALGVYQAMPEPLKNHKSVLQQRFLACCGLPGQLDEGLRAYQAASPANPGIDIHLLDYYVLHRQFDDLLACVERLDKELGGDPHLDFTRAFVYLQKGDLAAAKKCAQNAAVAEPESPDAGNLLKLISQAERNLQSGQSSGNSKAAETSPGEPAGDAEARVFAETFEKTVRTGDTAAIQAAVDIPAFNRRAMAKVTVPEEIRVGIEMAFSAGGDTGIARIFIGVHSQVERGADFRLLHVHRDNGEQRALFRLVHANDTVAYFDCILVRHADGKVRVDDVYLVRSRDVVGVPGPRVAGHLPRGIRQVTASTGRGPHEQDRRQDSNSCRCGNGQNGSTPGKYQEALDIYNGLPDRLPEGESPPG